MSDYLIKLYPLVCDEDNLIPVSPTETQNICILCLQENKALLKTSTVDMVQ